MVKVLLFYSERKSGDRERQKVCYSKYWEPLPPSSSNTRRCTMSSRTATMINASCGWWWKREREKKKRKQRHCNHTGNGQWNKETCHESRKKKRERGNCQLFWVCVSPAHSSLSQSHSLLEFLQSSLSLFHSHSMAARVSFFSLPLPVTRRMINYHSPPLARLFAVRRDLAKEQT